MNGVGAASELRLGFYELSSKRYKWRTFDKPMEIVSLAGNIARHDQGKMMLHLHGVFADDEYRTIGGHVKDFVAGATVELFVQCWQKPLSRKYDDNTGLQLLDLVQ